MEEIFLKLHKKLETLIDLNKAMVAGYYQNNDNNLIVHTQDQNEYFSVVRLTIGDDLEVVVRVWKHNLAEVINCKRYGSAVDNQVYRLKNGVEIPDKSKQYELNLLLDQTLTQLLNSSY